MTPAVSAVPAVSPVSRVSPVSATRGAPRVLRGVTLAGCSAALTVAAHAAAGGSVPSPGLTLVLTVLLAGAGVALADRRRGFPAILAAVAASQLGMHVLLAGLGHGHGGAAAGLGPGGGASTPVAMVVLHAVAAVITAVLLAGAENAVFAVAAVLRWLLGAVAVGCRPLPPLGPQVCRIPGFRTFNSFIVDVLLRRVHARRGPPCLALNPFTPR